MTIVLLCLLCKLLSTLFAFPEGIEIGWVIWDLDQIPARGIEQIKEWYAGFSVKASACVECGVCMERCPFDVEIIAKMREAAAVFDEREV